MSKLSAIKEFLEGIPQFVRDLEMDDPYLTIKAYPGCCRYLQDYKVTELDGGIGYAVDAFRAPDITDLISFSLWHTFKAEKMLVDNFETYDAFLREYPVFKAEFNLEEFCKNFLDYYLEFLNDAGFTEDEVEVSGNHILIVGAVPQETKEDTVAEPEDEVDDSVEELAAEPKDESETDEELVVDEDLSDEESDGSVDVVDEDETSESNE